MDGDYWQLATSRDIHSSHEAPAILQPAASNSNERAKFCYVISQLNHQYSTDVEDITTSPPEQDPYTTLRTELLSRLSPSRDQRIHQLLMSKEMDNQKPSRKLKMLNLKWKINCPTGT
jgi:hypothetical protein